MDQLKLIIKVLGPPSEDDLSFINSSKARAYIRALPQQEVSCGDQRRCTRIDTLTMAQPANTCWCAITQTLQARICVLAVEGLYHSAVPASLYLATQRQQR